MAWTYSGDPLSSDKDAVRFEIGDTIEDFPLLQDGEIEATLTLEGSTIGASARCCEVLARKFARDVDNTIGPQRTAASQRYKHFASMARELRRQKARYNAPYAGGLSKEEQVANRAEVDLRQPLFSKGMMTGVDKSGL